MVDQFKARSRRKDAGDPGRPRRYVDCLKRNSYHQNKISSYKAGLKNGCC